VCAEACQGLLSGLGLEKLSLPTRRLPHSRSWAPLPCARAPKSSFSSPGDPSWRIAQLVVLCAPLRHEASCLVCKFRKYSREKKERGAFTHTFPARASRSGGCVGWEDAAEDHSRGRQDGGALRPRRLRGDQAACSLPCPHASLACPPCVRGAGVPQGGREYARSRPPASHCVWLNDASQSVHRQALSCERGPGYPALRKRAS